MPEIEENADAPAQPARKLHIDLRRPKVWLIAAGIPAALVLILFVSILWGLPLSKSMEPMQSPTLLFVSADGKPFARRGAYKDEPVDASALPKHVPMAFVSIEDRRFFSHMGVDIRGIARALTANVDAGGTRQGGSTITQQLAKNAFTDGDRTLRRKVREAVIALYLEARLSKNEILSRYLSSVYFGEGVFGLRGAARHYFDKAPEELTVGEAAILAGVIKAPTNLSPRANFKAAKERQQVVLDAMVDNGVITSEQAKAARNVKVRQGRPALPVGSWFADWVSAGAKDDFDRAYGEVRVQTTLDSALQAQAERILRRTLDRQGKNSGATQAALVAMRPDGRVVAMVGGRDYKDSQFNRAVQAQRQPGSSFKLFVYLAALRRGQDAHSQVLDAPIKVGNWSPENYEGQYTGHMIPLTRAFARSSNVAAVRLAQDAGTSAVIKTARDLGLQGELPEDATLALGTGSVNLLEMTAAYAAIAAGQAPVTPYGMANSKPVVRTSMISSHDQAEALQLLAATVNSGTGTGARLSIPAYGKTGTTQDYRDAWFIGFAGDLVVGVWMGNDDNSEMKRVTGGSLPAGIWREFMGYAQSRGAIGEEPFDAGVPIQIVEAEDDLGEAPFMDADTFAEGLTDWFAGQPGAPPPDAAAAESAPSSERRRPAPQGFKQNGVFPPPSNPRRPGRNPERDKPVDEPDETGAVG